MMKTLTFYEVKKKKNPLVLMTCFQSAQSTFQTAPLLVSRYPRGRIIYTAVLCHLGPKWVGSGSTRTALGSNKLALGPASLLSTSKSGLSH